MTLSGTPKSGLDLRSSSFSDSNSAAQSAASSRKRQTQFFASVISRALALETEKNDKIMPELYKKCAVV